MTKSRETLTDWKIKKFSEDARPDQVTDELFQIHAQWNVISGDIPPSQTVIASKAIDNLLITFIDIPPVEATREPNLINKEADDRYSIMYVLAGHHIFSQGNRELQLQPEMLTVWNMSKPVRFCSSERFKLFSLIIPGKQMRALAPDIDEVCLRHLDSSYGEGYLLASHMKALSETVNHKSWFGTPAIADASLRFAAATINSSHLMRNVPHSRPSLYHDIRTHIANNLGDHFLTPKTIARHFDISAAYLHRIFQKDSLTVSGLIRHNRLELAKNMLGDGNLNHLSITDICFQCGFSDSSHFSRLFQKEFAMRPSDMRKAQNSAQIDSNPATL
ncbi:MAG: helix-turn-helix domain-containing protein [Porticoccaceae bacterium]|nr:helix-turn-helix domain-containing protein [Porticoccaceae bacterium]